MDTLKNTLLNAALVLATTTALLATEVTAQGATGAGVGVTPSQSTRPGKQQCRPALPLPPPDPSTSFDWTCVRWAEYAWSDGAGPVTGRMYWPQDCGPSHNPVGEFALPVVLLMHGDGHQFTDYKYLVERLASNGFIVATISNSGTNVQRAAQAKSFLGFMRDHWTYKDWIDASNVALIGHSRGGEAVLTAARLNQSENWGYGINAVIALAPTDNQEGGGIPESLSGTSSHSLLVIYGSSDEDVSGYCLSGGLPECGTPLVGARRSGFSIYDRAGSEGETEPFPLAEEVVDKALVYIEGANHNSWRSTCNGLPLAGELSCASHRELAKGYMVAFLRWKLRGMGVYENYFNGNMSLPVVVEQGIQVHKSYQKGLDRRVIDNFEQPGFLFNTLGGLNWRENTVTIEKDGSTWDYEPTSPHDTRSATISWAPPGLVPYLRFDIPDGASQFGGRYRDVTRFEYLSLRAGQVYGSMHNTPGQSKDFYVQLIDANGAQSDQIRISEFADLNYPEPVQVTKYQQLISVVSSPMKTIRIPVCSFDGVDHTNISSIKFSMNAIGSSSGEIFLDNIEFTD